MPDHVTDDDDTKGIQLDAYGDPPRQGTRMIEYESYERVIEGLRIAADRCMHIAKWEPTPNLVEVRRGMALRLDQCRRACIQHAGIDDVIRSSPTGDVRGEPLPWKQARNELLEGLTQAAGGARQLATCFRIDLLWSEVARQLENLIGSIRNPKRMRQRNPLLLPTGYVRH